jgi:hypothetical protein
MELAKYFKLVTGIKTACTHAGIDPIDATIQVLSNENGLITSIRVKGNTEFGFVTLEFDM